MITSQKTPAIFTTVGDVTRQHFNAWNHSDLSPIPLPPPPQVKGWRQLTFQTKNEGEYGMRTPLPPEPLQSLKELMHNSYEDFCFQRFVHRLEPLDNVINKWNMIV